MNPHRKIESPPRRLPHVWTKSCASVQALLPAGTAETHLISVEYAREL